MLALERTIGCRQKGEETYELTVDGGETVLAMTKTAFGPMTEEEALRRYLG